MKAVLITLIFTFLAVYVAKTLQVLQFMPARFRAFVSIALVSIILLSQPALALYLVIASVSFFSPRYWWGFLRLWLHQWIILYSIIIYVGISFYQRKKFAFHPLDRWIGAFLLTFVVGSLYSADLGMSIRWTSYFLILVGGYLLTRLAVEDARQLVRITWFLILCGAGTAVISFFRPTVGPRVGSLVLTNPNSLGNYLAMLLPLPLSLLFHGRQSPGRNIILCLAIALLTASIILTLSRSSWIGCGVGLLALGLLRPRFRYFALVLAALTIVFLIPPVQNRILEDRDDPGVSYRKTKADIAYRMFKEAPILGHGPGAFQALSPELDEWAAAAHSAIENLYMRLLAEGGILQAAVFLGLIVYSSILGWSTVKALPAGPLQAVVLGSLAAFWAALGIGIGEDILLFPKSNWLIGFFLAVLTKATEYQGPGEEWGSPASAENR